jgi:hypothetical protein
MSLLRTTVGLYLLYGILLGSPVYGVDICQTFLDASISTQLKSDDYRLTKEDKRTEQRRRVESQFALSSAGGQTAFYMDPYVDSGEVYGVFYSRKLYFRDSAAPEFQSIKQKLKSLGVEKIVRWVDITESKEQTTPSGETRFFIGTLMERSGPKAAFDLINLYIPKSAMVSDQALLAFLKLQIPQIAQLRSQLDKKQNERQAAEFEETLATILNKAYDLHAFKIKVDTLRAGVAGDTSGKDITIAPSQLNKATVGGVVIHEITHATLIKAMGPSATLETVGRAIHLFSRATKTFYHLGYHNDEFEARLRQAGFLKSRGLVNESREVIDEAFVLREEQIEIIREALLVINQIAFNQVESHWEDGVSVLKGQVNSDVSISIPIPSQSLDKMGIGSRDYIKMVLNQRLKTLFMKTPFEKNPVPEPEPVQPRYR